MSVVESDEELSKIHAGCMHEYLEVRCPVCNKAAPKKSEISKHLEGAAFKPGEDELGVPTARPLISDERIAEIEAAVRANSQIPVEE